MNKTAASAGAGGAYNADAASPATGNVVVPEKFTIALSEQMLARGRAVLLEGALPSKADAFCLLAPPFGDGYGTTERFIEIWSGQPLARSYDARRALDDVSVDAEDLNRLRDVLARDLVLAPEASRVSLEEAVVQLDMALAWRGNATSAMRLSSLAACHSRHHGDPAERLVAAASSIALAAGGAGGQGFPAFGLFPPRARQSGTDAVARIVASAKRIIRGFAGLHMKHATSRAAVSSASAADREIAMTDEILARLRSVPDRLRFVDAGPEGAATFAALMCPAPSATAGGRTALSPEHLHQDYRAWAIGVMTSGADVLPFVDGLMMVVGRMTVGEDFSVRGLNRVLHELQSLGLPDDPEDSTAARPAEIVALIRLRLNLYAAHLGDPEAAARTASWSAGNALANLNRTGSWAVLVAALAWAERSAIAHALAPSYGPSLGLPEVDDVTGEGFASRLERTAAGLATALAAVSVVRTCDADREGNSFSAIWRRSLAIDEETRRSALASASASAASGAERESVVVVRSIAEARNYATKDMHAEFLPLLGKPMPLVFTRDVRTVYKKLTSEAPHARAVIDVILRDTAGSRTTVWRPTLLVGRPGSGKTALAVRLCQEMQVPFRVFGCGGVSDNSFSGTSRQWSTGRASVPVQTIKQFGKANIAIILDEVEKIGEGRRNGNLIDGLLAMSEPVSSSRIFDVYLEGEVDLHRVLWLATANDLSPLHPALLDRFRILEMPDPRRSDLLAILPRVISDVAERRGLPAAWIAPFDAVEMDVIADLWPGGSIRRLARIVEVLMDARDNPQRAN
jgi:hypothetical protein